MTEAETQAIDLHEKKFSEYTDLIAPEITKFSHVVKLRENITAKYHPFDDRVFDEPKEGVQTISNLEFRIFEIDIPSNGSPRADYPFISRTRSMILHSSSVEVWGKFSLGRDNFKMHTIEEMDGDKKAEVAIATSSRKNQRTELGILDMPFPLSSLGVNYDFPENSLEQLTEFAERRIPKELYSNRIASKSELRAYLRGDKYDVHSMLYFQADKQIDQEAFRCYEVEVFHGDKKNVRETEELSAEVAWQEQEDHYCLLEQSDFPIIPFDLQRARSLSIDSRFFGKFEKEDAEKIGSFPLSLDGKNEWYAIFNTPDGGYINVLHTPSWRRDTISLVYGHQSLELTSNNLLTAVNSLKTLKDAFKSA